MVNVGYRYHERANLSVTPRRGHAVSANSTYTEDILVQTFPGGIETGNDFITEFSGFLTIDTNQTTTFTVGVQIVHRVQTSPVLEFPTPVRSYKERIPRSAVATVPLAHFGSRVVIESGPYTDADGNQIQIDDALLANDVEIIVRLSFSADDGRAFELDVFEASLTPSVVFYQLVKKLPSGSIAASDLADGVIPDSLPPSASSVTTASLAPDLVVPDSAIPSTIARDSELADTSTRFGQALAVVSQIGSNNANAIAAISIPTELPPTDGSVTTAKLSPGFAVTDAQIPASIARDSEIPDVSNFITAADVPPAPTELPPTPGSVTLSSLSPALRSLLSSDAPIDPERPTFLPTDSLKRRIDATLAANGWAHGQRDRETLNSMPRAFSSKLTGFRTAQGRLVPVVEVVAYFSVNSRSQVERDIEASARELLMLLNVVPDCYPELSGTFALTYGERYITLTATCLGTD